jgi:hypothetical protein
VRKFAGHAGRFQRLNDQSGLSVDLGQFRDTGNDNSGDNVKYALSAG